MAATRDQIDPPALTQHPDHLRIVTDALERLHYGVIQLTIHNGKLTQVDVTERRRFT